MSREPVTGWDLGGAHLKAARLDASGAIERVVQRPCPLWQGLEHFEKAAAEVLAALGNTSVHAITMTGEMADLFANRQAGVTSLAAAMRRRLPGAELRFYAAGHFVGAEEVSKVAGQVASANWMASAGLVAAHLQDAVLVDIGSTTTDVVPVCGGRIQARGHDDAERLATGELVYTGVVRTPLLALAELAPFDGEWRPILPELFATAADVHRLTGRLPAGADQHPAVDGGEKTDVASARRLARAIGRDLETAPLDQWKRLAAWLAQAQLRRIDDACARILSRGALPDDAPVVVAGVGRFLIRESTVLKARPLIEFGSLLAAAPAERDRASDCAPAVAVAWAAQRDRAGSGD